MEAVGAAASILGIAGAGIQISLKLIAFANQVGTASQRIQDVGTDVSVTAGTLQELGELMKNTPPKKSTGLFRSDQIQNIEASSNSCGRIFDKLKDILGKASQQLRDAYKLKSKSHDTSAKIKLSKLECMKWPFLQPSMASLLAGLRDAKGTLTLILQVVHLRHAHTTASLDREEQNDLIRMIAIMKRQQLASLHGDKGGSKALDAGNSEDSDCGDSEARTVLEAWSVTPNTTPDHTFQQFLITSIPVSQQQILQQLETAPQDFREVASMIDSLSTPERGVILEEVLERHLGPDGSSIRSILSHKWTGSHDLFGKVSGRKFRLIIERQVRSSEFAQTDMNDICSIPAAQQSHSHPAHRRLYNSSDSDDFHDDFQEMKTHKHKSSSSTRQRAYTRERLYAAGQAHSRNSRPSSDDDWKRRREMEEMERREEEMRRREKAMLREEQVAKKKGRSDGQSRTERQPASEPSDDDLVKSLLTQYTSFEPGEPLVQVFATPPPTYDEAFIIPKRDPRPY